MSVRLTALAALDGGDGADLCHVGKNGAPGDAGEYALVEGCDFALVDELVEAARRNAERAHSVFKAKLHVYRHDASIIAQAVLV
jgi:hypothetical protein